ncbi:acyltransferase [Acidisoma cellulosilytica]|uniref:Acyltransferase n=1 Tax=Acidisoma cellulosilyticum TaxID=2802395 RepID=A0A964E7D1_9PROT|nr:acyltransferase [Acidisoma cellulosilyticum]MCB8883878.1 acyltransferase [Acidisoma cellulosilyticum]
MEPDKAGHQHIAALDGLRGIAAFAVVWYHMTGQAHGGVSTPFHGYLAVDFFLILSGLVVARAYETKLRAHMTLLRFVKIRLIRLYPMILLGIACGFASKLVASYHFSPAVDIDRSRIFIAAIFGLLLIPYPDKQTFGGALFPLDIPLWTLMLEVWVNILYAAILVLKSRTILFGMTILAITLGSGADIVFAIKQHYLNGGSDLSTLSTGIARIGCAFFIGVALHHLLTPSRVAVLPSIPFPVLALSLLGIMFMGPAFDWPFDILAVLVLFPAIVVLGVKDRTGRRWRKLAIFAGAVSYPVYVLHEPTFAHFAHIKHLPAVVELAIFSAAFGAIVAVSYAASRFYDEPVRHWLNRRLQTKPRVPAFAPTNGGKPT